MFLKRMLKKDSDYKIVFDEESIQFLEKQNKLVRKRVWTKLISAKANPFRYFKRLTRRKDYRLRIGKIRIIADIKKHTIEITKIEFRKKVYK